MDLRKIRKQKVEKLSDKFCGRDNRGNEMAFTSYYLTINGKPFFGIQGECHYSRVHEGQWEDTVMKMKMGGINTVSTYCFWNHHEEEEGRFRFDGNRNVRKFIEICHKHGMYVIVRIGPYAHGEVRNGGIPDWMYGKPFEVRSLDEGWLSYTRRLFRQYAGQFRGLYYKDGGPIIGVQIENEYMHSSSPWEMTTGITNEWVPGGSDGAPYMRAVKRIAEEEGIITPFYTCTGWGGAAAALDEMLPLWGGYAFWPWIFYDYRGEHPATPEYLYRDNHNNAVPKTYNFEPAYEPESFPYACCEMGGGMTCYYNYRFKLPYESVDAMANIKIGSGCNFLGYYMYRGGSNPKGERTPYLNECQCPKISYDYQAAIGEYGQLRPSYFRLKALHYLVKNFEGLLCDMITVLPEGSQEIEPQNQEILRYALRTDGKSGFLFLNNYQDHCACKEKKGEKITLELEEREINIEGISIAAGEEAVLPFMMDVEGCTLIYAKAQPLSFQRHGNRTVCFFFVPEGMEPEYVWDGASVGMEGLFHGVPAGMEGLSHGASAGMEGLSHGASAEPEALSHEASSGVENVPPVFSARQEEIQPGAGCYAKREGNMLKVTVPGDEISSYVLQGRAGEVEIVTLTRQQSLRFYELEWEGEKLAALCSCPLLYDNGRIWLESPADGSDTSELLLYPPRQLEGAEQEKVSALPAEMGIFQGFRFAWKEKFVKKDILATRKCGPSRYTFRIPEAYADSGVYEGSKAYTDPEVYAGVEAHAGYKDARLRIMYEGDVGHLFVHASNEPSGCLQTFGDCREGQQSRRSTAGLVTDGGLVSDNFCNGAVWEIGLKEVWNPSMGDEMTIYITPRKEDAAVDVSSTMAGRTEQMKGAVADLISVEIWPVGSVELELV